MLAAPDQNELSGGCGTTLRQCGRGTIRRELGDAQIARLVRLADVASVGRRDLRQRVTIRVGVERFGVFKVGRFDVLKLGQRVFRGKGTVHGNYLLGKLSNNATRANLHRVGASASKMVCLPLAQPKDLYRELGPSNVQRRNPSRFVSRPSTFIATPLCVSRGSDRVHTMGRELLGWI